MFERTVEMEILSFLVFIFIGFNLGFSVAQIPDSKGTLASASPDTSIDCRYPVLKQPPIDTGQPKVEYKCCDGWGKTQGRDAKCVKQICPVGFKRGYKDGCYKIVTSSTSWHVARNSCQMTSEQYMKTKVSSDLVVIDSEEEEIFIRKEIHASGMSAAWIGLREVSIDGPLIWVNGSPLKAIWQHFKHKEPDENNDRIESCVSIVNSTHDMTMKWEDRRCSNLKGYMCEIRRACPPGYSQEFDGNCYRFVLDDPKDWYSARMDCKLHNFGDLLVFDQALEIRYYNAGEALVGPRTWPNVFIGLFRGTGGWRWVDGLPFTAQYVTKHRLAEGDNLCAVVDASRNIRSLNCTTPMPYACEIQRNKECFKENNAQDYSGKLTISEKGRECNAWNETQYSRRHNYCRYTPGRERPWCNVDHGPATTWEFCYVGEPQKYCEKGDMTVESCGVGQCPSGSLCHPITHECICPHGYEGLHCDRLCANNRWGYKCSRECPCGDVGNCDPVTGAARCNVTCLVDQSNTCSQTCGMLCLGYLGCQCDILGECICPAYVMGVGALFLVLFAAMFVCFVLCCLRKKLIGESNKNNSFIRHLSLKHYPKDVESIDMWILPASAVDPDSTTRGSKESEDSGVETKDYHDTTSISTSIVDAKMAPKLKPTPMKRNSSRLNKIIHAAKRNVTLKRQDYPRFGVNSQETVELRGRCVEPPGAEYSSPYELRNKELLLGDDESSDYYAFADPEVLNNDFNGYVNDSVTKVRRKKVEDYRLIDEHAKNQCFSSSIHKEVIHSNIKESNNLQLKTQNSQSSLRDLVQQKTSSRSKTKEQKVGPGVKPKPKTKRMKKFSKSDSELRRDFEDHSGERKTRFNTTAGQVIISSDDTSAPLLRSSSDSSHRKSSKSDVKDPTTSRSSTDGNVVLRESSVANTMPSILDGNLRFNKHKTTEPSVYVNERIGRNRRLSQTKQLDVYEII